MYRFGLQEGQGLLNVAPVLKRSAASLTALPTQVGGVVRRGGGCETTSCGTTCGELTRRWPLITSSRSNSLEPSRKSWNRSRIMHGGLLCPHIHSSASETTSKWRFSCCLYCWLGIKLFTDITTGCEILESTLPTMSWHFIDAFLSI